ncbi:mechanosensitive ion channel family protein [Propionibacteriaceae bacterium Y1923]
MISSWTWPDTLIEVGVIMAAMAITWQLARVLSRRLVRMALNNQERHLPLPGLSNTRTRRLLGLDHPRQAQRTKTLGSMVSSVAGFLIVFIGTMMILSTLGFPMGPLLTSAGIGGVAIGFGAQTLIKDFLSGLFLIAEDQYGVGDIVDLGEVSGTVEEVGLRATKVRDANGQVWYVRNGEIVRVGNVSQGWSNAVVDIPVGYQADPDRVIEIITGVVTGIAEEDQWKETLLETPTVLGVESLSGTSMTFRVTARCVANQQWGVQREIRERSKVALDRAGIPGPAVPFGGSGGLT